MVRSVLEDPIEQAVIRLFAQVTEALARATWALLNADIALGRAVVREDVAIDDAVEAVGHSLWREVDLHAGTPKTIRRLVALLLVIPELERSADLAEHIAQRAVTNVGVEMTPVSRGIVQRMSEVAIEMWRNAADGLGQRSDLDLDETDEELDILHDRLTAEVAVGHMEPGVAAQVTLIARFYERLGDHAVNLCRRMANL